jgi:glucose/arabinose dehydrogenase
MKTKLFLLCLFIAGIAHAQVIDLELVSDAFESPSEIANAGDDRLFVVEQTGSVRILNADGSVNETDFLDVASLISTGGERGLLGLAFHPEYATNGYFYINYTNIAGNTVIARYTRATADASTADPASALIMLTVEQPFSNHNGGCLRFGIDGMLYIAMGDGGSGGDPGNRAQNKDELLGKILRLNVDIAPPYIPEDNPFVNGDGADEVWAYGLRNPWKFSFDNQTFDLWIADVGQNNVEEINYMPAPLGGGVNYGWKCFEGSEVYSTENCSVVGMYTMPVAEYVHEGTSRCSITGGYNYKGNNSDLLFNKYIFADYCSGEIGILGSSDVIVWTPSFDENFTTFGEDNHGELYIASADGDVYRIVDTTAGLNEYAVNPFTLHPNPANDEVFVSAKDGFDSGIASVFNVNGQLVLQQEIGSGDTKIDTSRLQTGVYMLKLETGTGRYNTKLVIN